MGSSNSTNGTGRKESDDIFCPEPPPWPTDPKSMEAYRRDAEHCRRVWQGDSEVVIDAFRRAHEEPEEMENENKKE